MKDGSPCPFPATHYWGPVKMCCRHFDFFVHGGLFNRDAMVPLGSHIDIVREYNEKCERDSILPDADCPAKKLGTS
jgi:hypothetical protein